MHVRGFCLCAQCIAVLVVDEDEERLKARVSIASTGVRHSETRHVSTGVVRRHKVTGNAGYSH